jgi:dienelactone hydrolase
VNKVISELIDTYALFQLHREKSSAWHFKSGGDKAEDFEAFYSTPQLPSISFEFKSNHKGYKIESYRFESENQTGDKCNKYATGLFYSSNEEKSPLNIVFVHGWRSSDYSKLEDIYLEKFMSKNYNMYFATLPYHLGQNAKESLYNGEFMISADVERTALSVKQAVSDIRALIRWIKANNSSPVVLIGLSLGGLVTNMVGVTEEQIDGLVSIFYANDLAYTIWETIPGKHIKADFEKHGFTYEELKKGWEIIKPGSLKPVIPKENILLLTAKYDKYVHKEDADQLWEAWDRPNRVLMDCGHSGIVLCKKAILNNSFSFIEAFGK